MIRLFVGAGRRAGIRPGDLVGAITGEVGIQSRSIGAIEINDGFSLVEVPEGAGRRRHRRAAGDEAARLEGHGAAGALSASARPRHCSRSASSSRAAVCTSRLRAAPDRRPRSRDHHRRPAARRRWRARGLADVRAMTERLLKPFREQRIPVIGFVNEGRQPSSAPTAFARFSTCGSTSGADLGNHSVLAPQHQQRLAGRVHR